VIEAERGKPVLSRRANCSDGKLIVRSADGRRVQDRGASQCLTVTVRLVVASARNRQPHDRAVLKQWLAAGVIEPAVFYPTTAGTPQGGVISPALMNLTLEGLEALRAKHFPRHRGGLVNLVRLADDLIITGRSSRLPEDEVRPLTAEFLKERGLQLSERKTRITHIEDGFEFLGHHLQKHDGKLISKPARRNVQAFLTEIKTTCRENLHTPVDKLLIQLNPKIRGWALFHRSFVSQEIFNYVDFVSSQKFGAACQ